MTEAINILKRLLENIVSVNLHPGWIQCESDQMAWKGPRVEYGRQRWAHGGHVKIIFDIHVQHHGAHAHHIDK